MNEIYTIGHSTLSTDKFLRLLQGNRITAVADVRSAPYSRHNPQFDRDELRATLAQHGIQYVFLGKELGARSDDECCYVDDKAQYALIAKTNLFQSGIARVMEGATSRRIALMCAEKNPLECHRTILVARELVGRGCTVTHILADGTLQSHDDLMYQLVASLGLDGEDMFRSKEMSIAQAYDKQGERIAYVRRAQSSPLHRQSTLLANESED